MATESCTGLTCPYHPKAGMSLEEPGICRCNHVDDNGNRCTARKRCVSADSPTRGKPLKGWKIK